MCKRRLIIKESNLELKDLNRLRGRSKEAQKKYADYLFTLATFSTTGFLLIFVYPFAKIFDSYITNFSFLEKKFNWLNLFSCSNIAALIIFFIVWLFALIYLFDLSMKLENRGMDIYDKFNRDDQKGFIDEIM